MSRAKKNSKSKLVQLKELFSTPDKWTKKAFARDSEGNVTAMIMPDAVCWCLFGGLVKVFESLPEMQNSREKEILEKTISKDYAFLAISAFNDDSQTTFEMVHQVIDGAIELEKNSKG
jgi:hypothetical protein